MFLHIHTPAVFGSSQQEVVCFFFSSFSLKLHELRCRLSYKKLLSESLFSVETSERLAFAAAGAAVR